MEAGFAVFSGQRVRTALCAHMGGLRSNPRITVRLFRPSASLCKKACVPSGQCYMGMLWCTVGCRSMNEYNITSAIPAQYASKPCSNNSGLYTIWGLVSEVHGGPPVQALIHPLLPPSLRSHSIIDNSLLKAFRISARVLPAMKLLRAGTAAAQLEPKQLHLEWAPATRSLQGWTIGGRAPPPTHLHLFSKFLLPTTEISEAPRLGLLPKAFGKLP